MTGVERAADDTGDMRNDMDDLEDILAGNPESETTDYPETSPDDAKAEPVETEKPEAKTEPDPKADTGEKDDAKAPPAKAENDQTEKVVPIKALEDERHKRQELERRIAQIEQAKQPEDPEPDQWEDPEGHKAWRHRQDERRDLNTRQMLFQERCNVSEMLVRSSVGAEKYDAAYAAFVEAVEENPAIRVQLSAQANPAQFAYDVGQRHLMLKEIGSDPDAYRAKLKAEILAELKPAKAEDKQPEAKPEPEPDLPKSLAGEKSAAGRKGPAWGGPTPLSEILPD